MSDGSDEPTRLDTLTPLHVRVGYGCLGTGGSLGYEGLRVSVGGEADSTALSTHGPARLLYHFGGGVSRFTCRVALNDDVPPGASYADFVVIADGREVASERGVRAGERPRTLEARLDGAHLLELVVATSRWDWCHAVWLEPTLDGEPVQARSGTIRDPLGRVEIEFPPELPAVERCIATIASPGWEQLLDDMLGSLLANGGCPEALVAVLLLGESVECEDVVAKYGALPIRCRPIRPAAMGSKAALYAIASLVVARRYVCLDADMLVLGDLRPVFAAIDAVPEGSVLACREGNSHGFHDLEDVLRRVYGGEEGDIERILGGAGEEGAYRLPTNDGLFAGSREALLSLEATIRAMPGATRWVESNARVAWRNQFVFNLALARLRCGVELDERYNLQLHCQAVEVEVDGGRPQVRWQGGRVSVLHANGFGRNKYPELRGLYSSVAEPVPGRGPGDSYAVFLAALRGWLGRRGLGALGWTFYGASEDAPPARVSDGSMLPVLALLHYLVRASGCCRVLETGTHHGVSTACLASAVAHRFGARVVTLDPGVTADREALWAALPAEMSRCIEPRQVDSLTEMRSAAAAGETYDAVLLDSLHTHDHVLAEVELAAQLVPPLAPIFVHDWHAFPGVDSALKEAEQSGFAVVRLLGEGAVVEENGLGLAIVQRPRSGC